MEVYLDRDKLQAAVTIVINGYMLNHCINAVIICFGSGLGGGVSSNCMSVNNPIVLRTCAVEAIDIGLSVIIPCTLLLSS